MYFEFNFHSEIESKVSVQKWIGPLTRVFRQLHAGRAFRVVLVMGRNIGRLILDTHVIFSQLPEATDTMSAKFGLVGYNSSRKHISISIPSSTEVMSPHIKSVEELKVLGINLSSFGAPTQFFICVTGVFVFYLIYGYLQVTQGEICNLRDAFQTHIYKNYNTFIYSTHFQDNQRPFI